MTLQQKFEQAPDVYNANFEVVKDYSTIADEFAIEFANWINNKVVNPNGTHHNLLGTTRATQLLPIFKKEKGL